MEYEAQQKLRDLELHAKLLEVGREIEKTDAHQLEPVMIEGIIATFDHFGISDIRTQQMAQDLMPDGTEYVSTIKQMRFKPQMYPMYKIFDWLGSMYDGWCVIGDEDDELVFRIITRMVEHYIAMKDVGGWVWSYRGHIDLDIELDKPYANGKHCKDCIDSYKYWHNQTPAERLAEQKEKEEIFGKVINV